EVPHAGGVAFTDQHDPWPTQDSMHQILVLGERDGLLDSPASAEHRECGAGCSGSAFDLAVSRALGASTEHDQGYQDAECQPEEADEDGMTEHEPECDKDCDHDEEHAEQDRTNVPVVPLGHGVRGDELSEAPLLGWL